MMPKPNAYFAKDISKVHGIVSQKFKLFFLSKVWKMVAKWKAFNQM